MTNRIPTWIYEVKTIMLFHTLLIPHIPKWKFETNKVFGDLVQSVAIIGQLFSSSSFFDKPTHGSIGSPYVFHMKVLRDLEWTLK